MKTKIYYKAIVTTHESTTFENPLMANELHLIAALTKENRSVTITRVETSEDDYKFMFGY
jgi:hypothetical protein